MMMDPIDPVEKDPKPSGRGIHAPGGRRRKDKEARVKARALDRVTPLLLIAMLVVTLIATVVSIGVLAQQGNIDDAQKNIEANQQRIDGVVSNGCERTQLLRDDLNIQAYVQYTVIRLSQGGSGGAAAMTRLAPLFAAVDPATRALLLALLKGAGNSHALYGRILHFTQYLPPTSCAKAQENPAYRFPRPIPFSRVASCFDPVHHSRPDPKEAACRKGSTG